MSTSTLQAILWVVLILGALLLMRAMLKGGKSLGALWDKREELKRERDSRKASS